MTIYLAIDRSRMWTAVFHKWARVYPVTEKKTLNDVHNLHSIKLTTFYRLSCETLTSHVCLCRLSIIQVKVIQVRSLFSSRTEEAFWREGEKLQNTLTRPRSYLICHVCAAKTQIFRMFRMYSKVIEMLIPYLIISQITFLNVGIDLLSGIWIRVNAQTCSCGGAQRSMKRPH